MTSRIWLLASVVLALTVPGLLLTGCGEDDEPTADVRIALTRPAEPEMLEENVGAGARELELLYSDTAGEEWEQIGDVGWWVDYAWAPDGETIAALQTDPDTADLTLHVFGLADGEEHSGSIPLDAPRLAWGPRSESVYLLSQEGVSRYDLSAELMEEAEAGAIEQVSAGRNANWSPDGRYLFAGLGRGSLQLLDADEMEIVDLEVPQPLPDVPDDAGTYDPDRSSWFPVLKWSGDATLEAIFSATFDAEQAGDEVRAEYLVQVTLDGEAQEWDLERHDERPDDWMSGPPPSTEDLPYENAIAVCPELCPGSPLAEPRENAPYIVQFADPEAPSLGDREALSGQPYPEGFGMAVAWEDDGGTELVELPIEFAGEYMSFAPMGDLYGIQVRTWAAE